MRRPAQDVGACAICARDRDASYFEDIKKFASALAKLGFDVTAPTVEGAFVRIYAHKNSKKPDAKLVLPFRGAA